MLSSYRRSRVALRIRMALDSRIADELKESGTNGLPHAACLLDRYALFTVMCGMKTIFGGCDKAEDLTILADALREVSRGHRISPRDRSCPSAWKIPESFLGPYSEKIILDKAE